MEINIRLEEAFKEELPGMRFFDGDQRYDIDLRNKLWRKVVETHVGDADAGDAGDAGAADDDTANRTTCIDVKIKRIVLGTSFFAGFVWCTAQSSLISKKQNIARTPRTKHVPPAQTCSHTHTDQDLSSSIRTSKT